MKVIHLQLYAFCQRFMPPDADLGMSGKLLKKILSSSLLCFSQSKDDAIATTLITQIKKNIESAPHTYIYIHVHVYSTFA